MSKEKYQIQNGGRVKMAGGSSQVYYEAATPMLEQGIKGAYETTQNFKELREKPPLSLLMAFFPDDPKNIKQRLRGAGLYRYLRMDQGPGGNFTAFRLGETDSNLQYKLTEEHGYVVVEYSVDCQLKTGQFGSLMPVLQEVQTAFHNNDYRKTAQLVESFQHLSLQAGLSLPNGEQVGSKSGFFFIRPIATDYEVRFPYHLIPELERKVTLALEKPESLAQYASEYIKRGNSYEESTLLAAKKYEDQGPTEYGGSGLLYFQPDCFVTNDGSIEVEKINIPDVGMFLTQFEPRGNAALEQVIAINQQIRENLETVMETYLPGHSVTLITRDEVVFQQVDTLEILEIEALRKSLEKLGKNVQVVPLSRIESLSQDTQLLLLNISVESEFFGKLVTKVVTQNSICYPDPLIKAFQEKATTLRRIELSGKKLETFINLIKPKELEPSNASHIHAGVLKYLEIAGIKEEVMYVSFEGLRTPIPIFKYSLHSFSQIYNALEKESVLGRKPEVIYFSPVPFSREKTPFTAHDGARLAAFRFMFTK